MRISKVIIKEFKRFKELTIDLGDNPARIVALVGPNGCGKSSVFDSLLTKVSQERGQIGESQRFHQIYGEIPDIFFRNTSDKYNSNSINIYFENGQDISNILAKEPFKTNPKSIFSFRSPYRYSTDLKVKELKSIEDIEKNSYGASSSIMLDKRIENNYRQLDAYFYKYLKEYNKRYLDTKEDILGKLNKAIKNCLDLEISDIGDIRSNKGTLFFKKSESEEEFEYDCLSAGEKEVVDLLLDLFLRIEKYPDSIFLFDEPELHINTAIQRKLLVEINELVGEKGQIWIATHSIGFLRALQDDFPKDSQIIKFSPELKLGTENVTLEPMDKTRKEWLSIFQTALDDLVGLLSPKRIIYCEGRDKPDRNGNEKGMDAKVLNTIFNGKYPDTFFVSSGGNTELDQRREIAIAILNKALPDLEVWVFKDRDIASGGKVSQDDRSSTLRLNDDYLRIMKRWEIENYLFDEEVLREYCLKEGKNFNENKYLILTENMNINDDDYKNLGSDFVKVCDITTNISQDRFKEDLSKYITPDMNVYKELEECIFHRK